jgi:hypothetical protein
MQTPNAGRLGAFLVVGAVFAATAANSQDYAVQDPLPAERTQGSVTYVSGGIGHDEAMAFRQLESDYPLALEFITSGESGAQFLADVNVTIVDRQGNVLLQTEAGPLLLARLPDGNYRVTAAVASAAPKERNITVAGRRHEHIVFQW